MFSTCLICHRTLGANDVLETFPVGRRLAFDERTGRLWVVCSSCGHWNLSPLEERWEAIESCERIFREARIKVATDNIGLARLSEGLDLIRIGKPMRPEFSAWRYGPRIVARRRKAAVVAAGGVAVTAVASVAVVGASIGIAALATGSVAFLGLFKAGAALLDGMHMHQHFERHAATVTSADGHRYRLRQKHMRLISLERDAGDTGWRLSMHHEAGLLEVRGIQATMMAGQVLARLNKKGASKTVVQQAALQISAAGNTEQFIRNAITLRDKRRRAGQIMHDPSIDNMGLRYEERLALEMAMHEDAERAALDGELAALQHAWEQAEEIGAISDRMFDR